MFKKKVFLAMFALAVCLSGCVISEESGMSGSEIMSSTKEKEDDIKTEAIKIGIIQLMSHPSLNEATKGFMDYLKDNLELTDDNFIVQITEGTEASCASTAKRLINENCNLIMANAGIPLKKTSQYTDTIPILGTSISDYSALMHINNFNGIIGTNVSGTTDLISAEVVKEIIEELLPETDTVGIIYNINESNSYYQNEKIIEGLVKSGFSVNTYAFDDSSDVQQFTEKACDENDVLYIPTDKKVIENIEEISQIINEKHVPVITGDEKTCSYCGIATASTSYYGLGVATAEMAKQILKGDVDISSMPISYSKYYTKKAEVTRCEQMGITIPEDYKNIRS